MFQIGLNTLAHIKFLSAERHRVSAAVVLSAVTKEIGADHK